VRRAADDAGAARPGGAVAVEDLNLGTLRSDPPAPALNTLQAVYGATVRSHGGDPTIGPRLRALLVASGLEDVREDTVENPMSSVGGKPFLAELVRNMRAAILVARAATPADLNALQAGWKPRPRDRLLPGPHPPGLRPAGAIARERRPPAARVPGRSRQACPSMALSRPKARTYVRFVTDAELQPAT
jgi:hypothetical protein